MSSTAIVLAAGSGTRMHTDTPKQFLPLDGVPLVAHSLRVFEASPLIDEIILVTSAEYLEFCRSEIAEKYGFRKIREVVAGGAERYDSVYAALRAMEGTRAGDDYVFIHDSARPYLTEEIIERAYLAARESGAATAGVPSKDSIKLVGADGYVTESIDRRRIWNIQTPQVFRFDLIREAHERFRAELADDKGDLRAAVTDDAGLVERYALAKVKMSEGSYRNIKITTAEDLQ